MKSKFLTYIYILLGVISIISISIFIISNSNFIYYLYSNNIVSDYSLNELKEGYKNIVNYVVHGRSLNEMELFKYNDDGLVYLNMLRDFYFDLKLYMIMSTGFFVMIYILFKNKTYTYQKIDNHTPYLYIGYFTSLLATILLIVSLVNKEMYLDTLHELFFNSSQKLSVINNSFINIFKGDYFVLISVLIVVVMYILSSLFIVYDYLILKGERKEMSVKIIAIDLDGTLLNDEKIITKRTYDALMKAKEQGVYIVLASGRPIRGMLKLVKELKLDEKENYVINFNGAAINKTSDLSSIFDCCLTKEEMLEIEAFAKEYHIHSHAFVNGECYIEEEGKYSDVEANINSIPLHLVKYDDFNESDKINKYMFADEPSKLKEIYNFIPSEFFNKYTVVFSAPFFLEFLNKETNKGKALEALCKYLNISQDEVMAIGDEENDLSMLEFAAYKIAMGNANPKLKKIATYISSSNNEDGVGEAIEKFVINKI